MMNTTANGIHPRNGIVRQATMHAMNFCVAVILIPRIAYELDHDLWSDMIEIIYVTFRTNVLDGIVRKYSHKTTMVAFMFVIPLAVSDELFP
jgi:hypothetical protein